MFASFRDKHYCSVNTPYVMIISLEYKSSYTYKFTTLIYMLLWKWINKSYIICSKQIVCSICADRFQSTKNLEWKWPSFYCIEEQQRPGWGSSRHNWLDLSSQISLAFRTEGMTGRRVDRMRIGPIKASRFLDRGRHVCWLIKA